VRWASLGLLLCLVVAPAASQEYPTRTVRIVVPSPPGGGTDIVGRVLAQHFSKALGQSFVVENKPGPET
jgi:tripartite-type tricarboxylate transporter receptor subunit TctC